MAKKTQARTLTIGSWVRKRYKDERITWDELWMGMAYMMGMRARCVRDQVGAVIVSPENELLATGYVGPPAGMPLEGLCDKWCPRAAKGINGEELDPDYEDCYSIHAESNCALRLQRRITNGATLYVTSTVCWGCSKNIPATGVTRVVMAAPANDRRRMPEKIYEFLSECGIEVVFWEDAISGYRRVFFNTYGLGPHKCYFCDVPMPWVEAVHHINGDHSDDDPENLAPAHGNCHITHHAGADPSMFVGANRRPNYTTKWTRRKPILTCATCGLETMPGWLRRHCIETGHDDGGAVATYEEELRVRRLTCLYCGLTFETTNKRGAHVAWHRKRGDVEMQDECRGETPSENQPL